MPARHSLIAVPILAALFAVPGVAGGCPLTEMQFNGEAPFTSVNMYPAVFPQTVFPDEFRRVFLEMHTRIATTQYFDAWECHRAR